MKRSEMVELIKNKFQQLLMDATCESDDDMASEILASIEEKGMIPPVTELSHLKGLRDNAWDPE